MSLCYFLSVPSHFEYMKEVKLGNYGVCAETYLVNSCFGLSGII